MFSVIIMSNPWKYVKAGSVAGNPYFQLDPIPPNNPLPASVGEYILMPQTTTYAFGVHVLQEKCVSENNVHQPKIVVVGRELYRPNTFLENILARMHDYETLKNPDGSDRSLEKRKLLFDTWLDSCCGVAYQAGTTKFKLSLQ